MIQMFYSASSFDQTLCWDLSGVSTDNMFEGSLGSIGGTCAPTTKPTPKPTTAPAPAPTAAPTAAKPSDDGPDDGTLQSIGDSAVDVWSATKNLLKDIWGAIF
jgi:hypothetical protein